MNRIEYMTKLRDYLEKGGLPKDEMENALQYYEELFFEAGSYREEETAKELGDPWELAKQILQDNNIHADGDANYYVDNCSDSLGSSGSGNYHNENNNHNENTSTNYYAQDGQENFSYGNQNTNGSGILSKILILILLSPIILPVVSVVASVALVILVVIFVLICVGSVVGIGLLIGGIAALFTIPPLGVLLCGIGLILTGLGGLVIIPIVKFTWKLAVQIFNWIISCFRRLLGIGSVA